MEKRRQIEATNGEFQLPEPIIHHVQSFLTAKEAARTAILSKSWCSSWSTRPIIDLDSDDLVREEDSPGLCEFSEFKEFAEKTIQRYEQSNLKIQSFKIKTFSLVDFYFFEKVDLFKDLIVRALKIGATHLKIKDEDDEVLPHQTHEVVLPYEVFEAENLVGLSVEGFKIDDLGLDRKVRCLKLESLSLYRVQINSAMISNITSCCPLIEKLSLSKIRNYDYDGDDDDDDYDFSFLSDLSSKFPFLKILTLRRINAEKVQKVSSRTLERLNFFRVGFGLSVEFDVPSIRKFTFEGGDTFPLFSFASFSREWESNVSFRHSSGGPSTSWFRSLNRFLTGLSLSKVHLSLFFSSSFDYDVGDIRGLTKSQVENLMISTTDLKELSRYAVFDGLFRICHPKFITLHLCSNPHFRGTKSNGDLLCKTLVRGLDEKCMYGLQDLEEVNVQLFDEDVHAWCPLTLDSLSEAFTSDEIWDSFLDALVSPKGEREIRFQLKWMENAIQL